MGGEGGGVSGSRINEVFVTPFLPKAEIFRKHFKWLESVAKLHTPLREQLNIGTSIS